MSTGGDSVHNGGLPARAVARKFICAGVMLCAVSVYGMWPHDPKLVWLAGIAFGVAITGLLRP